MWKDAIRFYTNRVVSSRSLSDAYRNVNEVPWRTIFPQAQGSRAFEPTHDLGRTVVQIARRFSELKLQTIKAQTRRGPQSFAVSSDFAQAFAASAAAPMTSADAVLCLEALTELHLGRANPDLVSLLLRHIGDDLEHVRRSVYMMSIFLAHGSAPADTIRTVAVSFLEATPPKVPALSESADKRVVVEHCLSILRALSEMAVAPPRQWFLQLMEVIGAAVASGDHRMLPPNKLPRLIEVLAAFYSLGIEIPYPHGGLYAAANALLLRSIMDVPADQLARVLVDLEPTCAAVAVERLKRELHRVTFQGLQGILVYFRALPMLSAEMEAFVVRVNQSLLRDNVTTRQLQDLCKAVVNQNGIMCTALPALIDKQLPFLGATRAVFCMAALVFYQNDPAVPDLTRRLVERLLQVSTNHQNISSAFRALAALQFPVEGPWARRVLAAVAAEDMRVSYLVHYMSGCMMYTAAKCPPEVVRDIVGACIPLLQRSAEHHQSERSYLTSDNFVAVTAVVCKYKVRDVVPQLLRVLKGAGVPHSCHAGVAAALVLLEVEGFFEVANEEEFALVKARLVDALGTPARVSEFNALLPFAVQHSTVGRVSALAAELVLSALLDMPLGDPIGVDVV